MMADMGSEKRRLVCLGNSCFLWREGTMGLATTGDNGRVMIGTLKKHARLVHSIVIQETQHLLSSIFSTGEIMGQRYRNKGAIVSASWSLICRSVTQYP